MSSIISVIGAGTMGSGIAQVAGTHGCQVNIIDSFPEALENSQSKLKSILNRLVEKGEISEKISQNIITHINWTSDMKEVSHSNLVIAAIVEKMDIKQNIFI